MGIEFEGDLAGLVREVNEDVTSRMRPGSEADKYIHADGLVRN